MSRINDHFSITWRQLAHLENDHFRGDYMCENCHITILECMSVLFHIIEGIFFWISSLETVMQFLEKLSEKLCERLVCTLFNISVVQSARVCDVCLCVCLHRSTSICVQVEACSRWCVPSVTLPHTETGFFLEPRGGQVRQSS